MLNTLIRIAFSTLILISISWYFDLSKIIEYFYLISLTNIFFAFLLIFLSIGITSLRFYLAVNKLDEKLSLSEIHKLNISSQIFGLIFFSTFGQMLARNQLALKKTNQAALFPAITLFEKILAFLSLILLSTVSGVYLFQKSGFLFSDISFIFLFSFLIFIIIFNYYVVLKSSFRKFFRKIISLIFKLRIAPQLILNFLIHFLTLFAYVLLSYSLDKSMSLDIKICLFALIMLGAAIPISFSGWGPRELSAAIAFSIFSGDPLHGVTIAIIIGLISIISLLLHWLISSFIKNKQQNLSFKTSSLVKSHAEHIISFIGLFFIPLLIGIQIRIPTQSNWLTINLADPIAIMTGITILSFIIKNKLINLIWRIKFFNLGLFCFTITILYGLFLGFIKFGSNDWAIFNRSIGLLILFSYLLSGALIGICYKDIAYKKIVILFLCTTLLALISYNIFKFYIYFYEIPDFIRFAKTFNWNTSYFSGLMFNRNSISFAITLLFCLSLKFIFNKERLLYIGFLTFFTLVFLTESKTGILSSFVLFNSVVIFSENKLKKYIYIVIIFFLSFFLKELVENQFFIFNIIKNKNLDLFFSYSNSVKNLLENPDNIRFLSYYEGFKLFLSNPILGAGLGAFLNSSKEIFNFEVVIHNTSLWILAEMGLIGFTCFIVFPLIIVNHLFNSLQNKWALDDLILLFIFLCTLIYSQAHEIMYQRVLWFLMGLLIVNKKLKIKYFN